VRSGQVNAGVVALEGPPSAEVGGDAEAGKGPAHPPFLVAHPAHLGPLNLGLENPGLAELGLTQRFLPPPLLRQAPKLLLALALGLEAGLPFRLLLGEQALVGGLGLYARQEDQIPGAEGRGVLQAVGLGHLQWGEAKAPGQIHQRLPSGRATRSPLVFLGM
jgi:hypothetical protein